MPSDTLRLVSTVRESILVCESRDELLVLDRAHADAIRRYEALRDVLKSGTPKQQSLLFPDRLPLDATLRSAISVHETWLRAIGFDWSELAEDLVVVRSVPSVVGDAPGNVTLDAALRALPKEGGSSADQALRAIADAAAVAPGETLDPETTNRIVAAIRPSRLEHESCVRVRLPLDATQGSDA